MYCSQHQINHITSTSRQREVKSTSKHTHRLNPYMFMCILTKSDLITDELKMY